VAAVTTCCDLGEPGHVMKVHHGSPKGHPHTGEIYCVLDEDEILLNRSTLLIGVLLDAQPRH